ncbi:MAG: RnfABCDGE type electron transport complex subunit G [Lachnospiraceae bacterium]|nr:RnfABCDGE type electron transport complex subunit G [Lachnospiraceae bacterium]
MNKIVKDALVLTLITLIAGCALGLVYEVTKGPIAKAKEESTQAAYKEVFDSAASFADLENFDASAANKIIGEKGYTDGTITTCEVTDCVKALDASGNLLGYVVTMTSKEGYGGDIVFSMGVTKDGTLNGYSITEIDETPGLGMKAKEDKFKNQFKGIKATTLEVSKTASESENTIEAISGATITSKAVTYAVNAGLVYVNSLLQGGAS